MKTIRKAIHLSRDPEVPGLWSFCLEDGSELWCLIPNEEDKSIEEKAKILALFMKETGIELERRAIVTYLPGQAPPQRPSRQDPGGKAATP